MRADKDTILGLVFFGGLALVGWATISLTSLSLEPKPRLVVSFRDAQGLREGYPVYVLGKRMGQVSSVGFDTTDQTRPIKVTLELDQAIDLHADARIQVRDSSLLGGSQIDIDPGTKPGEPTIPLEGINVMGALDNLSAADLSGTVDSMKLFFDKLVDPNGSVGAALESREAFDDLAATLGGARRVVEEIEKGDGPLGRVIYDAEMGQNLSAAVQDLRDIIHKIDEGSGLAAQLLNDGQMAADVQSTMSNLADVTRKVRDGEGLIGRLVTSEDTANNFDDILTSVRSVARKADDPESGLLGALLADGTLRNDANRFMANIAEVTEKINNGNGLLGKIINDDELGEQLERLFAQVTGAIEDAREAAPVGTFFQVLAGPF